MLSPHGIRAATFDLDGLMFNTEVLYEEVGSEMLERRGKTITRGLLDEMMGRPSRVALEIMIQWHQLDATVDELQEETDETFRRLLPERLSVMPGLVELLDALEVSTIPKAIATSSRRAFADHVLGLAGLSDRFEFILAAEDVVEGKPHPEIYLTAARRFQLQPRQVLVLEDSENGCRAAVAAGTFTVAVPGNHSRRHDFTGAALVADGLGDRRIYHALGLA
jgi:HAD superfamily hydrolase (TIGR01509 family)